MDASALLPLSLCAALMGACDSGPPPRGAVAVVSSPPPAAPYAERVRTEIDAVKAIAESSPAATAATAPPSSQTSIDPYQVDRWLGNATVEQALVPRLIQDIVIAARLQPELRAAAQSGRLARDVLAPALASRSLTAAVRQRLVASADPISLRHANATVLAPLVRRFLIDQGASVASTDDFEAFVRTTPSYSPWRTGAIVAIAHYLAYPTVEQAALAAIARLLELAGREPTPQDLELLDQRAGALAFSRVAFGLREFSDAQVHQLQTILATDPHARRLFELTALAVRQGVDDVVAAINPSSLLARSAPLDGHAATAHK